MSELIEREDVIAVVNDMPYDCFELDADREYLIKRINNIPSANEPQGEWEIAGKQFKYIRCPYCKTARASSRARFCDWCGAQMKGADDEHRG